MKTSLLALSVALLAAPLGLLAQNHHFVDNNSDFGTHAGDFEFTLSGNGISDKHVDNSSGGFGASLGYYLNDTLDVTLRQTFNFINSDDGGDSWAGSTRVALDQHFGANRFQPFVGVNFGGIYGDDTHDTWVAGVEGGLKFYVQPRTFLFAMVDYAWTFDNSDDIDDTFDDGGFQWTVGVGFNF